MIELRPEVQAFAEAMELKLRQNDHKGGWKKEEPDHQWKWTEDAGWLLDRAKQEIGELEFELSTTWDGNQYHRGMLIHRGENWIGKAEDRPKILDEAVDTANFLMMIADVCGALDISKLQEAKEVKSRAT